MAVGIFSKTLLGLIAGVPVDAKMGELHDLVAVPSQFSLEDGSIVSDHIVIKPDVLTIPFFMSNVDAGNIGYGLRAASIYQLFRGRLNSRELYIIVTRHHLYENMAFVDLKIDHLPPFVGSYRGVLKFQKINKPKIVQISTDQVFQDGTQFKAASDISKGRLELNAINSVQGLDERINAAFTGPAITSIEGVVSGPLTQTEEEEIEIPDEQLPRIIPTSNAGTTTFNCSLNGTIYNFRTYWSTVSSMWFMDIALSDDTTIATGLALVPNVDIIGYDRELTRTIGQIRVIDTSSTTSTNGNGNATTDSLGNTAFVLYWTPGSFEESYPTYGQIIVKEQQLDFDELMTFVAVI